tara:strand:- start:1782 stop:3869 length:2088 start_codon:yes stop_codon:yes gene_type:complete
MLNNSYSFLIILITLISSLSINSQDKDEAFKDSTEIQKLQEVVVSVTKIKRQLSSLPLPAQIISNKEIQNTNSIRLSDLLNEQTGLITVSDFGGGEGIQLQGLDSQYTLILIDGLPLIGRSAGTLDLSRINIGNVQQIEIVKGSSSSLYGSEALGGVINIITQTPKSGFKSSLNYSLDTFNSHDLNINLSSKKKKLGIILFINKHTSDGYDLLSDDFQQTVEPFKDYTLNTKLTYSFSEKTLLTVSIRNYLETQNNVASKSLAGKSEINEWNNLFKINHFFNKKFESTFEFYITKYQAEEYLNDLNGNLFSKNYFDQALLKSELRSAFSINKKHAVIGGIGLTSEQIDRMDFIDAPKFDSSYIYLQYDGYYNNNTTLIVGARFDNHNVYNSQFSPKAALRFKFNNSFSIKSSIGHGFKAPDFRQLYFNFSNATVGYTVLGYNAVSKIIPQLESAGQLASVFIPVSNFNNELKAENSISYNIGIDYKPSSNFKLDINFFRNDVKDLIDTQIIAQKTNGQNVFSYYNVAKVFTNGIEFNSYWKLNNNIAVSGGYQLLIAKDKKTKQDYKNGNIYARLNPFSPSFQLNKNDYFGLFNRSRHMGNIKIFYNVPKWNLQANLRITYRSKYGLSDTNGNNSLDKYDDFVNAYSLWNIAINKTLNTKYKLGFGVKNIFDFKDSQNISNIAGQLIYGKFNINL